LSSAGQAHGTNTKLLNTFYALTMNDDGLEKSMWAPRGDSNSFTRSGDWACPSCGFSNYSWRKKCFRCSTACDSNGIMTDGHLPLSAYATPLNSISSQDTNHVYPGKSLAAETIHHTFQQDENREPGLSRSRWAPRNYRGITSTNEIWTRVRCQSPSLRTIANPSADYSHASKINHLNTKTS
jgi:hypothetical protein